MKKFLGCLLSVVLLVSFITVAAGAVHADDVMVHDYANVTPGADLGDALVANYSGPSVAAGSAFVADVTGGEGSSLKLAGNADAAVWEYGSVYLADTGWDFSGFEAIQFYVKRSGAAATAIDEAYTLRVQEGGGAGGWDSFVVQSGKTISYRAKDAAVWTKVTCADNGNVYLPANFEGYVEIPFASLTHSAGGDGVLNVASLYSLDIRTDYSNTLTVCVDDILKAKVTERTEATTSTTTTTSEEETTSTAEETTTTAEETTTTVEDDATTTTVVDNATTTTVTGTQPSFNKTIVLANYADKSSSDNAADALQTDSQGTAAYIDNIRGNDGSSLKLVASQSAMTWNAFSIKPTVSNADGMDAIEMYIKKVAADATSDNGAFRFAIGEGGGTSHWEVFRFKEGAKMQYKGKDADSFQEVSVLEDGSCLLPSGFEGVVRLPLDQLQYWYGGVAGGDEKLQKDNLFNIIITTDVNADTQYLVLDEILALGSEPEKDTDTETPSPESPSTGVVVPVAGMILLALTGGAGVMATKRRRNK